LLHHFHQFLIVIQAQVRNQVFAHHIAQRVLQLDQLLEDVVLGAQARVRFAAI
jgi:hypothetical protein